MSNKPLILVDIDGVLNAFNAWNAVDDDRYPRGYRWEAPKQGFAHRMAEGHSLLVPHTAHDHLTTLAALGEPVWATMWQNKAAAFARAAFLDFAADWDFIDFHAHRPADDDRIWGRWGAGVGSYKAPGIAATAGDRPMVWIDDDLQVENHMWAQARNEAGIPTLLVQPDPRVGLLPEHVTEIVNWVATLAKEAA